MTTPDIRTPQLCMIRKNLHGLVEIQLPQGYSIRHFRPGDEAAWEMIISRSFGREANPDKFNIRMKQDPAYQPQRVLFICFDNESVATASAWYKEQFGQESGYIHMVGVLPEHQGKKLGYWLNMAALHYFVKEGRTEAFLQTDDFRLAAIATYLKLGFVPHMLHESHPQRWQDIFNILDHKEGKGS